MLDIFSNRLAMSALMAVFSLLAFTVEQGLGGLSSSPRPAQRPGIHGLRHNLAWAVKTFRDHAVAILAWFFLSWIVFALSSAWSGASLSGVVISTFLMLIMILAWERFKGPNVPLSLVEIFLNVVGAATAGLSAYHLFFA